MLYFRKNQKKTKIKKIVTSTGLEDMSDLKMVID